jgi:hypothetical protein
MAKRPKAAMPIYEEFVFRVRDPSTTYRFGLSHDRGTTDTFDESLSLTCVADCLYPDRFAGRSATVHIHSGPDLAVQNARRPETPPTGVAFLRVTPSVFEVWAGLPGQTCWRVADSIANGTINVMLLHGPKPVRGKSNLTSISFHGPEFDPVEYVG